jgi:hypothetical protein
MDLEEILKFCFRGCRVLLSDIPKEAKDKLEDEPVEGAVAIIFFVLFIPMLFGVGSAITSVILRYIGDLFLMLWKGKILAALTMMIAVVILYGMKREFSLERSWKRWFK